MQVMASCLVLSQSFLAWLAAGNRVGCGSRHRDNEARAMSIFTWPLRTSSMDVQQMRDIRAIVGTEVMFTTLPDSLLREFGIERKGNRRVLLTDGPHVDLDYGHAWGHDRRRERSRHGAFPRRRCSRPAGDLHSYRSGTGGRSHRAAVGSHTSHPAPGSTPSPWVRVLSGPVRLSRSYWPCGSGDGCR